MTHLRDGRNGLSFPKRNHMALSVLDGAFFFSKEFDPHMTFPDSLSGAPGEALQKAEDPTGNLSVRTIEAKAEALHGLGRLRMRHLVARVMADDSMNVMLTLIISECQGMAAGEQSIVLANNLAPLSGAALIDDLVQAGLAVATGKMPGRRSVGLTPLGSARMRAYIAGFPERM
jgi:predicted transcriptional regulator